MLLTDLVSFFRYYDCRPHNSLTTMYYPTTK